MPYRHAARTDPALGLVPAGLACENQQSGRVHLEPNLQVAGTAFWLRRRSCGQKKKDKKKRRRGRANDRETCTGGGKKSGGGGPPRPPAVIREMDENDAILLEALEMAEQQRAGRAGAARDLSQQRMQQTRLPFAPAGARPEAHKPSLLAQNAATLQHEREVQARFRAAAAAQRHEKELERQDDTRHGGAQGAPAGARGARSGEAPARSQSLLCPRAPAVRIRPASLLGHDGRPDGAALTSAGLNVEQAKTLYMPSFGREYQRY